MDQPANQVCPTCGLPPARHASSTKPSGVTVATFICPLEHLWLVKWNSRASVQAVTS